MLLWLAIAIFTVIAVLAVVVPLLREGKPVDSRENYDAAVYRRQLDELERDREAGRIGPEEAEAARAEIGRRLIAADRREAARTATAGGGFRRAATAAVALVGIPLIGLGLYLAQGSPGLPDEPLQARLGDAPDSKNISLLVGRVEDHLARNPDDARGWEVLAPVYSRLGRPVDAARAYRNVIRLGGSTPARQTALGEALVMASGGIVTDEARKAFEASAESGAELDSDTAKARFYLALAMEQEGDNEGATTALHALLDDAPVDAAWRPAIEETVARIERAEKDTAAALFAKPNKPALGPLRENAPSARAGADAPPAATPARGPSQEEMDAAGAMAPEDRMAMIEGMVDNLADRLEKKPDDADGWLQLVRSYAVLGRREDAAEAARTALASVSDTEKRREIAQLAQDLRLPGMEEMTQ
ncbi:c-type cytochrome biogenesis protein CcmI [Afifella aestuarii]|uniref:c-type cytochrome biogenesis protein CcmI n=1 Tax=Afifella aestuarii TaxID=1909496 RepID=UPI000FE3B8FA|nr:c-type cytochrome biogenesis protein CcmI [Afifella aestuarii]